MRCRCCGSEMQFSERIDNCVSQEIDSLVHEKPWRVRTDFVEIWSCPVCSHRQAEYRLPDDLYEDYSDQQGYMQYYGNLQRTDFLLQKLAGYCTGKDQMFEIGSGGVML